MSKYIIDNIEKAKAINSKYFGNLNNYREDYQIGLAGSLGICREFFHSTREVSELELSEFLEGWCKNPVPNQSDNWSTAFNGPFSLMNFYTDDGDVDEIHFYTNGMYSNGPHWSKVKKGDTYGLLARRNSDGTYQVFKLSEHRYYKYR